jgi:hypothetical protein
VGGQEGSGTEAGQGSGGLREGRQERGGRKSRRTEESFEGWDFYTSNT